MCDSWEPCCFSLCDPGGLGGMRELLSARGRDRDLIRPSVCGDQGATVNQRQTDPSSPWGFTRFDPDTLSPSLSHQCKKTHTHTHTNGNSHKSACAHTHLLLRFTVDRASATPSVPAHTLYCHTLLSTVTSG